MTKKSIIEAMKHGSKLGAGAKKRSHLNPKDRGEAVIKEYARGTLHSGSGDIVKDKNQALAIMYSEMKRKKKK